MQHYFSVADERRMHPPTSVSFCMRQTLLLISLWMLCRLPIILNDDFKTPTANSTSPTISRNFKYYFSVCWLGLLCELSYIVAYKLQYKKKQQKNTIANTYFGIFSQKCNSLIEFIIHVPFSMSNNITFWL